MTQNLPALRDEKPEAILRRYLSDESTTAIAADYGVTRQALGQFLLKHAESEWKDAQVARAIGRKEAAEENLDKIGTQIQTADREQRERLQLSLAHAREQLRAAQWDLERVCKRIYGQDVAQVSSAVQININLRRESATIAAQHGLTVDQESDKQP